MHRSLDDVLRVIEKRKNFSATSKGSESFKSSPRGRFVGTRARIYIGPFIGVLRQPGSLSTNQNGAFPSRYFGGADIVAPRRDAINPTLSATASRNLCHPRGCDITDSYLGYTYQGLGCFSLQKYLQPSFEKLFQDSQAIGEKITVGMKQGVSIAVTRFLHQIDFNKISFGLR